MNLSINIVLTGILLVSVQQCGRDATRAIPDCVQQKIDEIAGEEVRNPPAKVYRYVYKGMDVYYIQAWCCDFPSELYDEQCNLICRPDGGFTGKGDNSCPDFSDIRTGEELVWEDNRDRDVKR